MKILKSIIPWAGWLILFIVLWFRGCTSGQPDQPAMTAEKKGGFPAVHNPVPEPAPQPEYVTNYKNRTVRTPYPPNQELYELYVEAIEQNDSLAKANGAQMYAEAIQEKPYCTEFDNPDFHLSIESLVRGDLLSVQPSYILKPRPVGPTMYFRMLAGLELGNDLRLSKPVIKGNVMFQNKKGDIFSGSYDAAGTVYAGYNKTIFTLKK